VHSRLAVTSSPMKQSLVRYYCKESVLGNHPMYCFKKVLAFVDIKSRLEVPPYSNGNHGHGHGWRCITSCLVQGGDVASRTETLNQCAKWASVYRRLIDDVCGIGARLVSAEFRRQHIIIFDMLVMIFDTLREIPISNKFMRHKKANVDFFFGGYTRCCTVVLFDRHGHL
jgi:hypothetical protein